MIQTLWRTVWRFLKKLKIELSYDPAIPLLGPSEETPGGPGRSCPAGALGSLPCRSDCLTSRPRGKERSCAGAGVKRSVCKSLRGPLLSIRGLGSWPSRRAQHKALSAGSKA